MNSLENTVRQVDAFGTGRLGSNENIPSRGKVIENLNAHDFQRKNSDIEVNLNSATDSQQVEEVEKVREHDNAASKVGVCSVDEVRSTKNSSVNDDDSSFFKIIIGSADDAIECEQNNVFITGSATALLQPIIVSDGQGKVAAKVENAVSITLSKDQRFKDHRNVDGLYAWPEKYRALPQTLLMEKGFIALCKVTMDAVLAPRLCCTLDKSRTTTLKLSPILQNGPLHCTVTLGNRKETTEEGESQHVVGQPSEDSALSIRFRPSSGLTARLPDLISTVQRNCNKVHREAFRVLLSSWRHKRQSTTPTNGGTKTAPKVENRKRADIRKRSLSSDCMADLVQDTELRELISNANDFFQDVLDSQINPSTPKRWNLCKVDEHHDTVILDPKALSLLTDEEVLGSSDDRTDSSVLEDKELRAVMKLTNDADDLSALFPTFSYDSPSYCDSDDGLDREIGDLIQSEARLRKELELATSMDESVGPQSGGVVKNASTDSTPAFSGDSFMAVIGGVHEFELSTDSSLADFQGTEHSSLSSFAMTVLQQEDTDELGRKVRFNDDIQEHIFEMQSGDDPNWMSSNTRCCGEEETFLDEVVSVFGDIMDELTSLCVTTSNALDRGRIPRPATGNGQYPRRSLAG